MSLTKTHKHTVLREADGSWNTLESVYVSFAQAAPSGLLLQYDPSSKKTTALAGEAHTITGCLPHVLKNGSW